MRTFTIEIEDIDGFIQIKAYFGEKCGEKSVDAFAAAASNAINRVLGTLTKDGPIVHEEDEGMEERAQMQLDIIRAGVTNETRRNK